MLDENKLAKLSREVRMHIKKLQSDMEYYKGELEKVQTGNTRLKMGSAIPYYLQDDLPLRFYFPREDGDVNNYIMVKLEDTQLYVASSQYPLLVIPAASNALFIRIADRFMS